MVSVLAFYSDYLSSNPTDPYSFSVEFVFENNENEQKRGRGCYLTIFYLTTPSECLCYKKFPAIKWNPRILFIAKSILLESYVMAVIALPGTLVF